MAFIPFTMSGLHAFGEKWRDEFLWPATVDEATRAVWDVPQSYLDAVIEVDDIELRGVALVGRPLSQIVAIIQFAVFSDFAARDGHRLVGHELLDLFCGGAAGDVHFFGGFRQEAAAKRQSHTFLLPRRIARTASWSSALQLPKALVAPDGMALSHNGLLRGWLRSKCHLVRNGYEADFDLDGPSVDETVVRGLDLEGLTDHVVARLIQPLSMCESTREYLKVVLRKTALDCFRETATFMHRVRNSKRLPKNLYSGTGSKLLSRAVGNEVIMRGGHAVRCDHGGTSVLMHLPAGIGLSELSVSTKFVTYTPEAAQTTGLLEGRQLVRPIADCKIEGYVGDSSLDVGAPAFRRSLNRRSRRRVMYVSTLFYGFAQTVPPVTPGPHYLDWQLRLLERLRCLPIDLFIQPHPGGERPPEHSNPEKIAPSVGLPFERAVESADVLLFDYPATTTLALGLCTDRPIVLIDLGTMHFNKTVATEIGKRCAMLKASQDHRNRLDIDPKELEAAILGQMDCVDPSFFRRLFLGDV